MRSNFQQHNPTRPPSWRFERVLEMVDARPKPKRSLPGFDDRYVREYRTLLLKLRSRKDNPERSVLFAKNPGLYYAHIIHTGDEEYKHNAQARILARETDEEVAKAICTLPSAIEYYEALFFNVRDRLNNHDYIVRQVMGPAIDRGIMDRVYDLSMKFFGYFAGSRVLNMIISGWNPISEPRGPEGMASFLDTHFCNGARRRSAMHINCFEVNKYNVMELFQLHAQLISIERQAMTDGGAVTDVQQNIMGFLHEIEFIPAASVARQGDGPRILQLAAELRSDEAMMVAAGKPLADWDEIKTLTLPAPRTRNEDTQQGS